jgi:hypothetical protein
MEQEQSEFEGWAIPVLHDANDRKIGARDGENKSARAGDALGASGAAAKR